LTSNSLPRQAAKFAEELQNTLAATICRGCDVRIRAVERPLRQAVPIFTIGHGLTRQNLTQPEPFPLRLDGKKPRAWMNLSFQVGLDDEERHLTVYSSYCGIFADEHLKVGLCHVDFEREKEQYTGAHLQVHGSSPALDQLNRGGDAKRPLDKLHFPVGGKRFRPSIEDVIEFLIAERIIDGHDGWEGIVSEGRERFQRIQLKAAMRRETALVEEFIQEQERNATSSD
jgi:hypothetical protein